MYSETCLELNCTIRIDMFNLYMCLMFPMSLDCPFLIASSVLSDIYLTNISYFGMFGWYRILVYSVLGLDKNHCILYSPKVYCIAITIYSNMTSFFRFVDKRAIYRLDIISLAHALMHVTDFCAVNVHVDELSSA